MYNSIAHLLACHQLDMSKWENIVAHENPYKARVIIVAQPDFKNFFCPTRLGNLYNTEIQQYFPNFHKICSHTTYKKL